MYEVKVNGRNGYRQFSSSTTCFSTERSTLEADLKLALANDQFMLVYQPQFQLHDDQVAGVEALILWDHPRRGQIGPGSFIGIAEESGLIMAIGDWVLAEACRQHRAWIEHGLPPMRLADHRVLTSEGPRASLRLAFPAALAPRWMPGLFPERAR